MITRDYTPIYEGDRYCLMCRHVCPVERVTKREATSPHGWALLVASVGRGLATWDADAVDTLYQCADCGLCQANCATNRPLPAAIVAARASVVHQGAAPAAVVALDAQLRAHGQPYGPLTARGVYDEIARAASPGAAIGLLVGATAYRRRPGAVLAALQLLRAAGSPAMLLGVDRSGAYLPYTVGLWETARMLVGAAHEELQVSGVRQVLTLCKEDAHAIAHLYPELDVTWPPEIAVTEFTAWLQAALAEGRLRIRSRAAGVVVYHDPCHTPRLPATAALAREVVARLTGRSPVELLFREQWAGPCGAVGGFPFTQPALAAALARERLAGARTAGGTLLITDDPQCAAHLAGQAGDLPVTTLMEMAAAGL